MRRVLILAAVVFLVLILAACGQEGTESDSESSETPRDGWHQIDADTWSRCINNDLMYYYDGDISVVGNSSECY